MRSSLLVLLAVASVGRAGAQAPSPPEAIPEVPPIPPGVSIPTTVTFYDVTGASAYSVWTSILEQSPIRDEGGAFKHAAYTSWRIDWRYRYAPSRDGCEPTSVTVAAPIEITVPRWTAATASEALRARWSAFDQKLRLHEDGHAAHVRAGAVRVHDALWSVRTATCDAFSAAADAAGHAVLDEIRARNAAYDRSTEHGRRQGAWWSTDD